MCHQGVANFALFMMAQVLSHLCDVCLQRLLSKRYLEQTIPSLNLFGLVKFYRYRCYGLFAIKGYLHFNNESPPIN